jgi:uncharacterized delta-60 repeat protein
MYRSIRRIPAAVRRAARDPAFQVEPMERRVLLSAGDLDPSFDGNGLLTTELPAAAHQVDAALALPGGKFLVGARAGGAYTIARLSPDGSYDRSFGAGGKVTGYGAGGMALAPDGRILVPGAGFGVARYNANGTVDTTFARGAADGDGVFSFDEPYDSTARAVAVRPDGKILLAGSVTYEIEKFSYGYMLALARLNPDGTPDTTFGGGDGIILSADRGYEGWFNGPVVLAGFKLLHMGYIGSQYGLARFNDDLTLDTTFGRGDGVATDGGGTDINVMPDGRIVLAGQTSDGRDPSAVDLTLARLTPNGRLDTTFGGGDGVVRQSSSFGYDQMLDAAVRADGSIVALTRYGALGFRPDGSPDPAFSGDGFAPFTFGADPEPWPSGGAVAPAADGGALFVGTAGEAGAQVSLVRLNAGGAFDPSFSGDGRSLTRFPARAAATDVLVQPDGKVVAAGNAGARIALSRYNPDGTLDRTFGRGGADGDGKVTLGPGTLADAALLAGGRTLVLSGNYLRRYNPDGSPDATFGDAGDAWFPGRSTSLAVLPDGKVIVAGSFFTGGFDTYRADGIQLARYNADGSLDASFGEQGYVQADADAFGTTLLVSEATNVMAGPDGRVYVTAALTPPGQFVVARFSKSGAIDRSFGTGGLTEVDMAAGAGAESADAIALADDGTVLVAGAAAGRAAVVRLRADGSPDTSFGGGDGVVTAPAGAFRDVVAVGGKILCAGTSSGDFLVARYNADGTPDTTFDKARTGAARADFGAADAAAALAVGPGGTVVAAGSTGGAGSFKFAVARFKGDGVAWPQTYQAESALVAGAKVAADHGGYTGSGFVDFVNAAGDAVQFTVDVPSAGWYDLSFRYANGGASDRSMSLSVNSQPVGGGITFARTGSWTTWRDAVATVQLAGGANKVRLQAAGQSGPNLDALALRPSQAPAAGDYQAEAARRSGPVAASGVPGHTGSGFVDYQHASGDWVEFTVEAPQAGPYVLSFRYANGGASDRPLELRVNGAVTASPVGFTPTGSWSNWGLSAEVATLAAGANRIRLTAIGSSGPNLDALTVSPRLTVPGTLDPTFGGTGLVTRDFGFPAEAAYDVVALPGGKVLAVGGGGGGYTRATDSVMLRYNDHGAPDAAFGAGGIVRTDLRGEFDERAGAVALLPDGGIVVAGTLGVWEFLTDYEFYPTDVAWLARYRPDGTLDPSFGEGGTRWGTWNDWTYAPGASLAVAADGSFLVARSVAMDQFPASGNGDLLPGPPASPWLGDASDSRPVVAPASGGKILVAGANLARLNADLTPDASFGGGDGAVPLDFDPLAVAAAPGGKILLSGRVGAGTGSSAALARFSADGSPDTSFGGGDGVVTADFGPSADYANDLAVLPDGRVVVALGGAAPPSDAAPSEFAVARFTADGRLDTTFGDRGRTSLSAAAGDSANAVAVDGAGRILVAGTIAGNFTVARLFG